MRRQQSLNENARIGKTAKAHPPLSSTNIATSPLSSQASRRRKNNVTLSSKAKKKRLLSSSRRSPSPQDDARLDLERFVRAQAGVGVWSDTYDEALHELRRGRKRGHWIWYVFPQVVGLSMSGMGQRFSIHSLDEARAYLDHPTLGARLKEATEAVLESPEDDIEELFGDSLDAQKLRSSMTMFAIAAQGDGKKLFKRVLAEYWDGEMDEMTVDIMNPEQSEDTTSQLIIKEEDETHGSSADKEKDTDAHSPPHDMATEEDESHDSSQEMTVDILRSEDTTSHLMGKEEDESHGSSGDERTVDIITPERSEDKTSQPMGKEEDESHGISDDKGEGTDTHSSLHDEDKTSQLRAKEEDETHGIFDDKTEDTDTHSSQHDEHS